MADLRWPRMTESEVSAFLGEGGIGVLAFTTDRSDPPYAIPVSYGYAEGRGNLHFRLSIPETSTKAGYVDRPVTFVTYGQTDTGIQSVVATGTLEDLSEDDYESPAIQERWTVTIPLFDVFEDPPADVTFQDFRLVPTNLTGRKEIRADENGGRSNRRR